MKQNIKIDKIHNAYMQIDIGTVTFLKMFLRGVTNLSFMPELYGMLCQASLGEKVGIQMTNGDRIIAVRRSSSYAEIISAYNTYNPNEELRGRIKVLAKTLEYLANGLFKINLIKANKNVTARSISTVRKGT